MCTVPCSSPDEPGRVKGTLFANIFTVVHGCVRGLLTSLLLWPGALLTCTVA
jgi:hypothetical protein